MTLGHGSQTATARSRHRAAIGRVDATAPLDTRSYHPRRSGELILATSVFLGFLVVFLGKAPGLGSYLTSQDHAYQLSIGTQVLLGRVPGVDVIIAYGPLVMYTSAFGLWLTHSLIGETILCATGYAFSLFLIYHLVSRYASTRVGLVAAGFGFLLQARFYKWYVWLIPLVILFVWDRYLNCPARGRWRWVVAGGFLLGICWLYRPDFGTSELLASLVFLGLFEAAAPRRSAARLLQAGGMLVGCFAVAPLLWLGYLAVAQAQLRR